MMENKFEPIAIIGMGMRLPGAVHDDHEFWQMLKNGRSGHCRVPESRYNAETWYGSDSKASQLTTQHGYYLDDLDLKSNIDLGFWSMGKQEAEMLEPGARLLLEVVYEALESSGTPEHMWRGSSTGVYIGTMDNDWYMLESRDEQSPHPVRADSYGDFILANRTSYEFDFKGPSHVVRTACSSSLVALHQACQDLQSGACNAAVVGGVNILLSPRETAAMCQQGVLSKSGMCKTFDADADGYGRGEGVSAVYLKPLVAAIRDGNPIRSVIRGTMVNSDGRTAGMVVPDPKAHETLIRAAYSVAGISEQDIERTAMVECHGTGTCVGDPLETIAVANIWGEKGIYIGSVKPNIGHGEGSSGVASLIKMTLALEHETIPPNINFKTPNPLIPFEEKKLTVPIQPMPWPTDRDQRVSINSFGIGGTNAHVILESVTCAGKQEVRQTISDKPRLLAFSTKRQASVPKLVQSAQQYLDQHPNRVYDVAYTLGSRRTAHPWRTFGITGLACTRFNTAPISMCLKSPPPVCWVFTGQGAQYAQMGKTLIEQEPLVEKRIDELDAILQSLPDPPLRSIKDEILKPEDTSRLYEAEISQPCLAAIQIAIVDLLRSWGCHPSAIVGHSSGETAAAYAAGAITAEQAIILNYHRGQITPPIRTAYNGSMAAIGLSRDEVKGYLRQGVIIGCENSPQNVTLSGETDILQQIMVEIRQAHPGILVKLLQVECAFHSSHMDAAALDFSQRISEIAGQDIKTPEIPFYSSVSGQLHEDLRADYWITNITSPVLFSQALQCLFQDVKNPLLIEIGPHCALSAPIRQIIQHTGVSASYIPTLVRGQDGYASLLETAGKLWQRGVDISLDAVNGQHHGKVLTDLPRYPWHHDTKYWIESRLSREWRMRKFARHELLGLRVIESGDAAPTWRNVFCVSDVPWMSDHTLFGETWFPATGFVAMIGEALRQLTGKAEYTVRNVTLANALIVTEEPVEIITSLSKIRNLTKPTAERDATQYTFTISSITEEGHCTEHVYGECYAGERSNDDQDTTSKRMTATEDFPRKVDPAAFYNNWRKHGLRYGPLFRGIVRASAHLHEKKAVAMIQDQVKLTDTSDTDAIGNTPYSIHPATMDSSIVSSMIASCQGLLRNFEFGGVPTSVSEIHVKPCGSPIRVSSSISEDCAARISGFDEHGNSVLEIRGFRVQQTGLPSHGDGDEHPHGGAVVEWRADPNFLAIRDLPTSPIELVALLSFKSPKLRVLDLRVGASNHFSPEINMLSEDGERCCDKYVVAYTSSKHETLSKEEPEYVQLIQVDLDQDLAGQGLSNGGFDLVIMRMSPCLERPAVLDLKLLSDVHKLLDADGHILVREVAADGGDPDYRSKTAIQLEQAGFRDAFSSTSLSSSATAATIRSTVARPQSQPSPISRPTRERPTLRVLCKAPQSRTVKKALKVIKANGNPNLQVVTLGDPLFNGRNQIGLCLLDVDMPFLFSATEAEYEELKQSLSLSDSAGNRIHEVPDDGGPHSVLWLTGASQINCTHNPNYALSLGFVRSLRRETGDNIVTLEAEYIGLQDPGHGCQNFETSTLDTISALLNSMSQWAGRIRDIEKNGGFSLETEYSLSGQTLMISRIRQIDVKSDVNIEHVGEVSPQPDLCENKATITRPRRFSNVSTLHSRTATRDATPEREAEGKHGHVAMSKQAHDESSRGLILASYAMKEVARIRHGQRILIHNAETPQGLASLQLARRLGLDVSITAQTVGEQARFEQMATLGVLRKQILVLGTRDGRLTPPTCFDIDNVPFDMVLSLDCQDTASLEGLAHLAAPFGTIVVIGTTSKNLHTGLFDIIAQQSLTFTSLDYAQLSMHRPELCATLLKEAMNMCQQPSSRQPARQKVDFLGPTEGVDRIAKSHHRQDSDSTLDSTGTSPILSSHRTAAQGFKVYPDRTYILVGGLGGLGLSTARFLADRGARHFVFFTRSAKAFALKNNDFVKEMQGYEGCAVRYISGDVASEDDVRKMASKLSELPPVGGVFNAAMVLADAMLSEMTYSQWRAAIRPKVDGTWNLHRILFSSRLSAPARPTDIDTQGTVPSVTLAPDAFLFLFSSLSGICQMLGQANYAAANSFLDAFAQYHTHITGGMPAAVLDIGAMEDVGVLARDEWRLEKFKNLQGVRLLKEKHFLDALEVVLGPWQQYEEALKQRGGQHGKTNEDVVGARRVYRSPTQMIIGFGSPSSSSSSLSSSLSSAAAAAASSQRRDMGGTANGLLWDFDPRLAFFAAACRRLERKGTPGQSSTTTNHESRESTRQKVLKDFLLQVRSGNQSSSSSSSPAILPSPEAISFLSNTIIDAIRNIKGEDDGCSSGASSVESSPSTIEIETGMMAMAMAKTKLTLAELGVDSLVTVELRTWVRHKLGVNLSVAEFRRSRDVAGLVGLIFQKLGASGGG